MEKTSECEVTASCEGAREERRRGSQTRRGCSVRSSRSKILLSSTVFCPSAPKKISATLPRDPRTAREKGLDETAVTRSFDSFHILARLAASLQHYSKLSDTRPSPSVAPTRSSLSLNPERTRTDASKIPPSPSRRSATYRAARLYSSSPR